MNLRELLIIIHEEQALEDFYGPKYDQVPLSEKRKFLKYARDNIENKVDKELRSLLKEASPENKRRRRITIFNLISTALLTPGIAYAVNIENWTFVWILSAVLVIEQIYTVFVE